MNNTSTTKQRGKSLLESVLSKTKFHFIGIGGIGMCGLAELMFNLGAKVTGSDISENKQVKYLRDLGITIHIGHDSSNVSEAEVIVYSSAIKPDNVEFLAARQQKKPLIARAEALAEIMRIRRGVAIAGTHGKTTTTSMTASVFIHANLDPTIMVGGRLDLIQSTAKLGAGEFIIAEADESDGSFHLLSPEFILVTNIDNDHMDFYKDYSSLEKSFLDFTSSIPFYGQAIVCGDDEKVRKLYSGFAKKISFYGFSEKNDYYLKGEKGQYAIMSGEEELGQLEVPLPGKHNALNALAATLCGVLAGGLKWSEAVKGINHFKGVDRRFQFKGEVNKALVYDDYAHHPTEVKAVLQAFKEKFPDKKVNVIFQPHRYSRMQSCWQDFLSSFSQADKIYVVDIYPAGEKPVADITSQEFVRQLDHNDKEYVEDTDKMVASMVKQASENDVYVTLGAGTIWKLGEELLKK